MIIKLGAIFMDMKNKSDFSDRNTMIYGHNLKVGGEMFSQLKKYEEESFYKEHSISIFIHRMEKQGLIPSFQQLS